MMWRTTVFLVTVFWLVMTFLLVRLTYFPEGTGFSKVPAEMVLGMFLDQGTSINTLHVYRNETKIGHASIASRAPEPETGRPDKVAGNGDRGMIVNGVLDKGILSSMPLGQIAWRFDLNLGNLKQIKGSTGQIRLMEAGLVLDYQWTVGEKMPRFTLKQRGTIIGDEKSSPLVLAQMFGLPGMMPVLPDGMQPPAEGDVASVLKVHTREGAMNFSGQKRNGYVLELSLMDRWKIKAFFTEVGELAVVDLPEGYRLVEPIIHGLQPDFEGADYEEPEL